MEEETRQVLTEFRNEITTEFRAFRTEITAFKTEMTGEIRRLSDKVGSLDQRVGSLDHKIDRVREEVTAEMTRYVGIVSEDFQHKLDLVVEGHQMLNEKIDRFRDENHREHGEFQMNLLQLGVRIHTLEQEKP